ncbi:MAG: nitroreductase family protein [Candidatus Omnitrophica bacterium]|nr:nitroreductase family protein [Candidatus Omnitrophota bacterium]
MDVFEAIKQRRSVRSYKDKPIAEKDLMRILEAARLAPSAKNFQEWRFVVVKDKRIREKLSEAAKGQRSVAQAPVVIACCAKTDNHVMTCGQLCYPIDLAIAIDHMILEATELGIGSCWIGAFYEDRVKEVLNIPEAIRVVELLPLGYPADKKPVEKPRLSLKEIVKYEKWS